MVKTYNDDKAAEGSTNCKGGTDFGNFLRILVASPPMVATCRRHLEHGGVPVMGLRWKPNQ